MEFYLCEIWCVIFSPEGYSGLLQVVKRFEPPRRFQGANLNLP